MFSFVRERLVSDYVPIRDHITDEVVLLDDGSVFAMFAVEGMAAETADADEVNGAHHLLNITMRNVANERLIWSVYDCRGLADPAAYPRGTFRSAFAEAFDMAYRDGLYERSLYDNRTFIGIQIRPARPAGEWVGDQVNKWSRSAVDAPADRLRLLENVCELLNARLALYRPRRLRAVARGRVVFSEIAEALAFAMTGIWRPIGLQTGRLGDVLFSERIIVGREAIEIRGPGRSAYAAMFGIREYPSETWPGMFGALKASPYRGTLFQSFRCMSKSEGAGVLTRKQNRMVRAGDKAFKQIADLDVAANDLASNKFLMGDHSLSLCVFADSIRGLSDVATAAWKDLAEAGIVVAREEKALEAAYFAQLPGNARLRVRPGAITSRNFCAFAPLHNYPSGDETGHWGAPIALFRTVGGTPYRFHLHVGDLGNVFVCGRAGSGKSTWLGFIIAQAEKTGAQVLLWDKDRGLEILVRAVGGTYLEFPNGEPTGLNPLKALDDCPEDREFLYRLILGLALADGQKELSPEFERRLSLAIATVMRMPPADRSLGEVAAFLGTAPDAPGARLRKWCWGHELGWVIDCPEDRVRLDAPVLGFGMTNILDNPVARGPVMATLFHRTEKLIDGRRVLDIIDEFWKALLDKRFEALVHDKLKTRRKRNSPVILATQSPRDALDSAISHTIREQCSGQVYFANPQATTEDYGPGGMNLTPAEFDIVRSLAPASGMFLLKQNGRSVLAQLPLAGMEDEIAVLSGREKTVRLLDDLPPDVLADPVRMVPAFHKARKEMAG